MSIKGKLSSIERVCPGTGVEDTNKSLPELGKDYRRMSVFVVIWSYDDISYDLETNAEVFTSYQEAEEYSKNTLLDIQDEEYVYLEDFDYSSGVSDEGYVWLCDDRRSWTYHIVERTIILDGNEKHC